MKTPKPISRTGIYTIIACSIYALLVWSMGCNSQPSPTPSAESPVNLDHIMSLVDSMEIEGQFLAYVNIYADAPEYRPVAASGEGVTCVDDVGRLLEVLEFEINHYSRQDLVRVARGLSQYLLYMSSPDGNWYNFTFADGTINKTHQNSELSFGWWAARGMRGLAAGYAIFNNHDQPFADALLARFSNSVEHLNASLDRYPGTVATVHGLRAAWLPTNAPDRAAEFLLSLAAMQSVSTLDYQAPISKLADGLLTYQFKQSSSEADGMYYCWENIWHGWGNLQAHALLTAFETTGDSTYLQSVERWATGFLRWTMNADYHWEVKIGTEGVSSSQQYPQIAYGIGSTFKGIAHLAAITGSDDHKALAETVRTWFEGANSANRVMYDAATGRCYDGINSSTSINLNSGAESTIEALSALQFASEYQ